MGGATGRGTWAVSLVALLSFPGAGVEAETVTFTFDSPIDLGSNVDRIGDLEWNYILGTEWDRDFSIGGIIGKKNATVIPEVKAFGKVIVPRVSADTRTGARMSGNVSGGTGLEFFADFNASGLEPGAAFDFAPQIVDLPSQVPAGEFIRLQTRPGVVDNPAFTEALVDLPSFEAGMNFFFDLELRSKVEAALFPVLSYRSSQFNPDPIHVNQSLLKFEFDLDPKSNGGVGVPPSFVIFEDTLFENRIEFLDASESIAEKQFSVDVGVKGQPGVSKRLDIGSAQLVNPFGTGESILGGEERNLVISTAVTDSAVHYSYETPLLRLGLDLDGIAAFLGTGESFTRLEETIGNNLAEITGDFIDIKYGPEIGYRETVDVRPDFEVTLNFDNTVVIRDGSTASLTDTYTGLWSDLPDIALIGDEAVNVTVSFEQLLGQQTKRGVFYLTDFLELTLLELEELKVLDEFDFSLPPVFQARTSILGQLLGEVELELTDQTAEIAPFALGTGLLGTSGFTLTPAPSERLYWADAANNEPQMLSRWRSLDDHSVPATFANATLTIARGDASVMHAGELTPMTVQDGGTPNVTLAQLYRDRTGFNLPGSHSAHDTIYQDTRVVIDARRLSIPEGSRFLQSGLRRWKLTSIENDGLYQSTGTTEIDRTGGLLQITGEGEMSFSHRARIGAAILLHGEGHTLRFDTAEGIALGSSGVEIVNNFPLPPVFLPTPAQYAVNDRPLDITQQIENAGTIIFDDTDANLILSESFGNTATGALRALNGAEVSLTTPTLVSDGLFEASGADTVLTFNHADSFGQINVQSRSGVGRFVADDGSTMRFTDTVLFQTVDTEQPQTVRFEARHGSTIEFDSALRGFDAGVAELHVDETSTLRLSGVEVKRSDSNISLVNHGLVEVTGGDNRFYFNPDIILMPGEPEPRVVGINVDNRGTVRILPGATFAFNAEIVGYVPGGATLGPGTWEILGNTPPDPFHNTGQNVFIPGVQQSRLEIRIVRLLNEDLFVGEIDFGDTDGDGVPDNYSPEDYDTELAVSEADVLLSGAARFDYLNTIRENRGKLTLRNNNHFTTDGDLLNRGQIHVESNARLNVAGDLIVDEGTVMVDASSVLDVGANTVEVVGGTLTIQRGAIPLNVNTPWIVREKWLGEDEQGNDIIASAHVSYGDAWFPTINPNADILVEGEQATFEPLSGVSRIRGKLTLRGGNELRLEQSLTNEGTLTLADAGKLFVDGDVLTTGLLDIAANSYLDVTGDFSATAGTVQLDGVVNASAFALSQGVTLSGLGRFTGTLDNGGTLSVLVADLLDAASPDGLLVDGQATLAGDLTLSLDDVRFPFTDEPFQILTADGGLLGAFDNAAPGQRLDTADGLGSFLVHYGPASPFDPDRVVLTDFVLAVALGDFDGDSDVDAFDLGVWQSSFGATGGDPFSPGDADGDGDADAFDLGLWQSNFADPNPPPVAGDADGDGDVDAFDLGTWQTGFGATQNATATDGDFDGDGDVDAFDLGLWQTNFGTGVGATVPEPGAFGLSAAIVATLAVRRRHRGAARPLA